MTDDITNVGLSETSILETPWGNLKGTPESLMFFLLFEIMKLLQEAWLKTF